MMLKGEPSSLGLLILKVKALSLSPVVGWNLIYPALSLAFGDLVVSVIAQAIIDRIKSDNAHSHCLLVWIGALAVPCSVQAAIQMLPLKLKAKTILKRVQVRNKNDMCVPVTVRANELLDG